MQGFVDDLAKEKEDGWTSRTVENSYTTKLHCLKLMGISMTRDALYKRAACRVYEMDKCNKWTSSGLTADQSSSEVST